MNSKKQSLLSCWPSLLAMLILLHFIFSLAVFRVYHVGSLAAALLLLLYFSFARTAK
ncbi:hypothetical protein Dalu01_00081 [Deinococcus aluminii]|uniref:Uncharacterized protein n=1 Tax=Deinococcus aluminii TaxID=1656885 RepID=A0ABP9X8K9_9DEIO